ncbi:helix-turn-helix domain-containing protein [Tuberibacillus sp. Marseille-P3662]|uniref:helix-turn-helix domain-containing protein n=1 Tax=Tuberibacillus sp. Marseille-P3662 TaxID=1965358 RepID=UPI001593BCA6|nr:helix-turn-helix domain-containing protein [Tuberibacillus sp. Marseille-P3662]
MPGLLLADRDHTERMGIRWFIQSNRIPFESIGEAGNIDDTLSYIESYQPDVVCLELEMIPSNRMTDIVLTIRQYVPTVICLTVEAVFERAVQSIELHTISLLVKPLSHEQLKLTLQRAAKSSISKIQEDKGTQPSSTHISYPSLFINQPLKQQEYSLILLRPEKTDHVSTLYQWLDQYPTPYPVTYFVLRKDVACVLRVPKQDETIILQQEGQRMIQRWSSEYPNRRLNLAIHPASVESASLHAMYLKTINLFKLSFFKGMQQLFWVNHEMDFVSIDPFLTPEEQRKWMTFLEEGDKQGVKNWLYQNFSDFQSPYPDPELIRVRFTSILAQFRRFMKTYHLDKQKEVERHYHDIFQTILTAPVMFSIIQEMILFVFVLMDGASKQKQDAATDVIERGLQYMEAHYHRRHLELRDVAEHVGMSPSYYSHLIVKKTGQSFRQILTNIRLKKACRLLTETTMTVREITDKVGYGDANYFSRVFKRNFGLSPRQFRQHEKSK